MLRGENYTLKYITMEQHRIFLSLSEPFSAAWVSFLPADDTKSSLMVN